MTRSVQKKIGPSMSHVFDSSNLSGQNALELAHLYALFLESPKNVDPQWAGIFARLDVDAKNLLLEIRETEGPLKFAQKVSELDQLQALKDVTRIAVLIRSYQVRGHLL